MTAEQMRVAAEDMGMAEEADLARFEVDQIREEVGSQGVATMAQKLKWELTDVLYVGGGKAVVQAKKAPPVARFSVRRVDGQVVTAHIKAVSRQAREAAKEARLEMATTKAHDGEDGDGGNGEAHGKKTTGTQGGSAGAKQRVQEAARRKREERLLTLSTEVAGEGEGTTRGRERPSPGSGPSGRSGPAKRKKKTEEERKKDKEDKDKGDKSSKSGARGSVAATAA